METRTSHAAVAGVVSLALLTLRPPVAALQAPPPTTQPGPYSVTNLATLCVSTPQLGCEEAGSRAFGVNSWGQAVGISHRVGGGPPLTSLMLRAFRTQPNQAINPAADAIGFGGPEHNFWGYGINDAGTVVGGFQTRTVLSGYIADLEYETHPPATPFVAQPNGPVLTFAAILSCPTGGAEPFGCGEGVAYAINAAGAIAGRTGPSGTFQPHHAFRLSGTSIQDLGILPGLNQSYARDISSSGLPVGVSFFTGFISIARAVRFGSGTPTELELHRPDSAAYAVNNLGQIAGHFQDGEAFFFDPNLAVSPGGFAMQSLGTLCAGPGSCTSSAFDISDTGLIVGESQVASADPTSHAFLLRLDDGVMRDLNDLIGSANQAWVLTDARGVNAIGQIVGTGLLHGKTRAYLLTPPLSTIFENAKALLAAVFAAFPGLEESLRLKLEATKAALDRGDFQAANGQLDSYQREVAALVRGGRVTAGQGSTLQASATLIRREMGR